jgi:hypothetical protein
MNKLIITICTIFLLIPLTGKSYDLPDHGYPRTANLYWKTPITPQEAPLLAKWDILALDMKAQVDSANIILKIRQLNPDIIILAYTTANEVPKERLSIMEPNGTGLWHDLISGIDSRWYLKTHQGKNIVYWPGNLSINQYAKNSSGETYNDYLVNFYSERVLSTGLWDGLLFDNVWNDASWVNKDIDIDGDGRRDSESKINSLWRASNQELFEKLRNKFGDEYLFLGNGDGSYSEYLNGRMFESFPEFWEGGWTGSIERYFETNKFGYLPRINIINADSDNTGKYIDSSRMRYGLTSTLLYDGYYSFDWSTSKRENFWWYDEFNVDLGNPKSTPINLIDSTNGQIKEGVWQREFENGIAILNSTDQNQTIKFDSEYEKIKSNQNPSINNGGKINELSLQSEDGTILLRPISEIKNSTFTNGSYARIFDNKGDNARSGFFAYSPKYRGGLKITKTDLDGGGRAETIIVDKSKIEIFSSYGFKKVSFYPYGENYKLGISIDFADTDHDGIKEIITGTENGGSNEIKIFNNKGKLITSWYAYKKEWRNLGVNVATGDVNGDGEIEIIAGAGHIGGPHVKIFNSNGKVLVNEFFSYEINSMGGTHVATGDMDGNGIDEIITGAGSSNKPVVKIFNYNGDLQNSWLAYNSTRKNGVKITTTDIDKNGIDEIIAFTTNVFTLSFFQE